MNTGEPAGIEKRSGIGFVIFNRAESLNIFGTAALERLRDSLTELEGDGGVKVIVLTGRRHFSAGADIRELKVKDVSQAEAFARLGQCVCARIEEMNKPVIAAVSGYALGAGCEIALACDIRIASENAKFGQPEVTLGIIPGFGGTQRLAGLVGFGRAKELILSGRIIDATEAAAIGLISGVVREEELLKTAEDTAIAISEKSPVSLGLAKRLINRSRKIGKELEAEIAFFAECFAGRDHLEGINAFLEKRKPEFRGE